MVEILSGEKQNGGPTETAVPLSLLRAKRSLWRIAAPEDWNVFSALV
jgi:hypothetical protein